VSSLLLSIHGGVSESKRRRKIRGESEMNIFNNLTGGQIFCIAIFGFMLLLILESLRRELMEKPWPKVVFTWICLIIGFRIMFYGFSEIQSGRWTGVIWVLFGPVIVYLGRSREKIEEMMQKRAEEDVEVIWLAWQAPP